MWRWTGDDAFRDDMYAFAVRNMHYVVEQLDADGDGWPEGLGNVERTRHGRGEARQHGLHDPRAVRPRRPGRRKGDAATRAWARGQARRLRDRASRRPGGWPGVPGYADSLDDPGNVEEAYQRHWIGVTPMEAELRPKDGRVRPGLADADHGERGPRRAREPGCFSTGTSASSTRGVPGCDNGPGRHGRALDLHAQHGDHGGRRGQLRPARPGPAAALHRRPTARLQLPDPDEQPGAMPGDRAVARLHGRSIDRPFYDRAMVLQAWGTYGTLWPVVHQQLGVRPDMGRRRLEVTPQVPAGQSRVAGSNIRLAGGAVDVTATHSGSTYTTRVALGVPLSGFTIGHTLPRGSQVAGATLDGSPVAYTTVTSNRGVEVLVNAPTSGTHELVVTSR